MSGSYKSIRIDESTDLGIVVTALQVVQTCLYIIIVATVAQRIDICMGAGSLDDLAVGVIAVVCCRLTQVVHQPDHIALQVGDVVVNGVVGASNGALPHGNGSAVGVVEEVRVSGVRDQYDYTSLERCSQ